MSAINPVSSMRDGGSANRRGIQLISAAMASFMINDAFVKWIAESLPAGQLVFLRGLVAVLLITALAIGLQPQAGNRLRDLFDRWVLARSAVDAVASGTYLLGLFHLPLATATAINLASPLFITLLAVLWLGERVGADRWLATILGFVGVLLIIQPSADGFNGYALVCLAATVLHAIRDTMTRRIRPGIPAVLIMLANATAVMAIAGLWSLFEGWVELSAWQGAAICAAALFVAVGYYLLIQSTRTGELSVVAPFRYTALLWALILGYLVWGSLPDALAWVGIGLLVAAGLYLFSAERRRQHRAALD